MEDFLAGLIGLVVFVFYIFCAWRIFEKAGRPGWMAIIPILNLAVLAQIGGKEWWWIILTLIPIVNIFVLFLIWHGVSENFGHGIGFTLGLFFLSFIFVPILALGDSTYRGRKAKNAF